MKTEEIHTLEEVQELLTLIRTAGYAAIDTLEQRDDPEEEDDEATEADLVARLEQLIRVLTQVDDFLEPGESPNYARIINAAKAIWERGDNDIDEPEDDRGSSDLAGSIWQHLAVIAEEARAIREARTSAIDSQK